jgi:hypothetical protein
MPGNMPGNKCGNVAIASLLAVWLPGMGTFASANEAANRIPPESVPLGQVWIAQDPGSHRQPEIGVVKPIGSNRYLLVVCPNTSHDLDISKIERAEITKPTTKSDNITVATSTMIKGERENWILRIGAGPNDTDEAKKTSITSDYTKRKVNMGMSSEPTIDWANKNLVIEVEVLPKKTAQTNPKKYPPPPKEAGQLPLPPRIPLRKSKFAWAGRAA